MNWRKINWIGNRAMTEQGGGRNAQLERALSGLRPEQALLVWLLVCVAGLLGYSYWASDRGLDITDESYYLLAAIDPGEIKLWVTAAHWFSSKLWAICPSLAGFRLLGLGILITSSLILALGANRAFALTGMAGFNDWIARISISISTVVGALLYGSFVAFTPSYNLLSVAAVYSAVGLAFLFSNAELRRHRYLGQLLVGAALSVAVVCKFPAGIAGFGVTAAVTVLHRKSFRDCIQQCLISAVGLIVAVSSIAAAHGTLDQSLGEFHFGLTAAKLANPETIGALLKRYLHEGGHELKHVSANFSIPLIFLAIFSLSRRALFLWLALASFVCVVIGDRYFIGGMDRYTTQSLPLFVAIAISLLASAAAWLLHRRAIALISIFLAMPFAVALGTSNPLYVQILLSLGSWGTLVGALAFARDGSGSRSMPAMVVCALLAGIIAVQTVTSGMLQPYRLRKPLSEQTELISAGQLGTIRVDRETKEAVDGLSRLAMNCGIAPNTPFLGMYDLPGVALLLQAIPVATPWLFNLSYAEAIVDHSPPETVHSAVIGLRLDGNRGSPQLPRQLKAFPLDYRLCGTVVLPYQNQSVEIWKPENTSIH